MKTTNQTLLSAALCAAALTVVACGRPAAEPKATQTASNGPAPVAAPAPSPAPLPSNELRPEPRSVTVTEAMPAPSPSQADLDAKARELAKKQAALDAREKALRDLERRERRTAKAPALMPETPRAEEPAAPEPAPQPAAGEGDESEMNGAEPEPAPEPAPAPEPLPEPVSVPAGTVMGVTMLSTVSSQTSHPGDLFRARISGSVRTEDGVVAIPGGSEIVGEVTEAAPVGKIGGQAKLGIRFTDIVLPDGTTVPVQASFAQTGKNKTGRDAATIGGGAAAGAVLGHAIGKGGKGSVLGAILGAVVGTVIASRTPGEEIAIDKGTAVDIKLDAPLQVRPRRSEGR